VNDVELLPRIRTSLLRQSNTHGYTELMFGLFELESRIFSPRIRDLAAQVLYPLEAHHRKGPLGALFRGPRIRPERIRANWDEMHRIAASLQDGTVTAQLLVSKLQALKQQHGAHTGIQELGRIFKTLAALTYISDEGYRRRIHHTLNKGELLHALAREVFFGQQGLFRERDYLGQLNRATCMSLIINAIVVWNTRYLLRALDHLRHTGYPVTDNDLKHITPLLWEHITFHGSYHFDLGEPQRQGGLRPLRAPDAQPRGQVDQEEEVA
jgi:TnpA family transposase